MVLQQGPKGELNDFPVGEENLEFVCKVACILISALGNKPIDNLVMTWTNDTLPKDWTTLRDKWWSLHVKSTIGELIALTLIALTNVRK